MAEQRRRAVSWGGQPTEVVGPALVVGDVAPSDFLLVANDLSVVAGSALRGRPRIICAVPSLDTAVCDVEMRRFNQGVLALPGVKLYAVSMDLPFAQKRWCVATASERVQSLSDFKDRSFGPAYGVFAPARGLLVRAVLVIDKDDRIRHVEYVPDVGSEPDYDAALAAARAS